MRYLLDTDTCVAIIRQRPGTVQQRLFALPTGDVGISVVTVAELSYGVQNSRDPARNAQALDRFLLPLAVVPFGEPAASAYGRVRAELEKGGQIIGGMDMLIAAHALALGATLVTNNSREFARIAGLWLENWLAEAAADH